ncbi:MAG: YqeG family HAD IIIA-type phosphatase [Bacilli bacterium]|jgi:HAD superfamily phosphatase (TIGR01668 family)
MGAYTPTYYAKSIYEVPSDFYKQNGIKNLFIDLDNTLDSFRTLEPTENAINLINELKKHDYTIIIISNNTEKRVKHYATILGVNYMYSTRKPFAFKFKKMMEENNLDPNETILIGDQLVTDVRASKRAKIRSLLTEKLVKEDQWTTHINRLFDRPIRRHLKRKNKLDSWRNHYE